MRVVKVAQYHSISPGFDSHLDQHRCFLKSTHCVRYCRNMTTENSTLFESSLDELIEVFTTASRGTLESSCPLRLFKDRGRRLWWTAELSDLMSSSTRLFNRVRQFWVKVNALSHLLETHRFAWLINYFKRFKSAEPDDILPAQFQKTMELSCSWLAPAFLRAWRVLMITLQRKPVKAGTSLRRFSDYSVSFRFCLRSSEAQLACIDDSSIQTILYTDSDIDFWLFCTY